MSARFRPMAILLFVLGALDSVQVFAANTDGAEPAWRSYTMFVVATFWHRSGIIAREPAANDQPLARGQAGTFEHELHPIHLRIRASSGMSAVVAGRSVTFMLCRVGILGRR